jgi:hypothetical protein
MKLNVPEISLELPFSNSKLLHSREYFPIKEFSSKEFYCLDGFPKDGNSCIVVIKAPTRD